MDDVAHLVGQHAQHGVVAPPRGSGPLDQARCEAFLAGLLPPADIDEAFICGPEPMMDAAEAALRAAGVPAERIHVERFGVAMPAGQPKPVLWLSK